MNQVWLYAIVSTIIVSLISFVGVFALSFGRKRLKTFLIYFVSFSAGALFGDAILHLLPEVVEQAGFTVYVSLFFLSGILFSFIVEKVVHWHHCHNGEPCHHQVKPFAIMNLVGDFGHNFLDGLVIGASYLVSIPVGLATTLAVVFHEIPQEIGDFGVLLHGGFSKAKALFFNFVTALSAIVGVVISLLLSGYINGLELFLVPFAAGGFIYIAGSDLIPELHKGENKFGRSFLQVVMFMLGIGVMVLLLLLE